MNISKMALAAALALTPAAAPWAKEPLAAAAPPADIATFDQSHIARRGFFYAGGEYVGEAGARVMDGAMYVEVLVPHEVTQPYPLVLIHGAAQTATNWMATPDGREGWADYFVKQGYLTYMVDQPARGRSAYHPEFDGELRNFSAEALERLFTDSPRQGTWAQAKKQTQWPGEGVAGDPVFDAFYATQVEFIASNARTQEMVRAASAALLDRIGPAILVTHSQAGPFGWVIADERPDLVKGVVSIEPSGPPFRNAVLGDGPARAWGPTDAPLTYDPPLSDPAELAVAEEAEAEGPDLVKCIMQQEPARQLPNLRDKPVLIFSAESSYHAVYDHCTARYLAQAGVDVEFTRLEEQGIRGNGHMVMLERNSADIAAWVHGWMVENIR